MLRFDVCEAEVPILPMERNCLRRKFVFLPFRMKKALFLFAFFLLTASNTWKASENALTSASEAVVMHHDYSDPSMPLGDGEEKSGEEDRDITDDDDVSLDHRAHSRETSFNSGLRVFYQETLFRGLEKEVVIPPPRA